MSQIFVICINLSMVILALGVPLAVVLWLCKKAVS